MEDTTWASFNPVTGGQSKIITSNLCFNSSTKCLNLSDANNSEGLGGNGPVGSINNLFIFVFLI